MKLRLILMGLCTVVISLASKADSVIKPQITDVSWVYSTEGQFNDVKEDLVLAIENQGAVVSYVAHANKMLTRTAKATGNSKLVYKNAEILLFCKAEITAVQLQKAPHSLVNCPYPIAIYTLAGQPNKVYLSIRKPPTNQANYQGVQQILQQVIHETIAF